MAKLKFKKRSRRKTRRRFKKRVSGVVRKSRKRSKRRTRLKFRQNTVAGTLRGPSQNLREGQRKAPG